MDGGAEAKRNRSELEVRRRYHPSRTAQAVLASVYEQIVASGRSPRLAWPTVEPDSEKDVPQPKQTLCAGG